jgi:phosphohistidine phosphatase
VNRFPDWIYRQSAALPYRKRDGHTEVLLVTSRSGRRWLLPKGIVEPGMTAPASAAREAHEEAGIEGAVSDRALGSYRQNKWGGACRIEVFPMQVTREFEDWPEAAIRRRKWLTLKAAAKRLESKKLRGILTSLPKRIADQAEGQGEPAATVFERPRLLYLLRHAKSSWDDPTLGDFDRPLAERGRTATGVMSKYLALGDVKPELVFCSSSARTRETLAGIQGALGESVELRFDKRIYHGGPQALLTRLRQLPDRVRSVMLIGHNPSLQALALQLSGHGDAEALTRMTAKFPTAALATLVVQEDHWKALGPGSCCLHSFVRPADLV